MKKALIVMIASVLVGAWGIAAVIRRCGGMVCYVFTADDNRVFSVLATVSTLGVVGVILSLLYIVDEMMEKRRYRRSPR